MFWLDYGWQSFWLLWYASFYPDMAAWYTLVKILQLDQTTVTMMLGQSHVSEIIFIFNSCDINDWIYVLIF